MKLWYLITFLFVFNSINAELKQYYPGIQVTLGNSYDELEPFENKGVNGFFTHEKFKDPAPPRISDTSINIRVASSNRELMNELQVNVSAEAKYSLTKFSGKYSKFLKRTDSKKSLSIILKASRTWEPENLKSIDLSDKGKKSLAKWNTPKDLFKFREIAGSSVITGITRGVSIDVVYNFYSSDEAVLKKIESEFRVSYSSASASVNFIKKLEDKTSNFEYTVNVLQRGGSTNQEKSVLDVIKAEPGNLKEIMTILANSMNAMDYKSATILSFNTLPLNKMASLKYDLNGEWNKINILYKEFVRENENLYFKYNEIVSLIKGIEEVLKSTTKSSYIKGGREGLLKLKEQYNSKLSKAVEKFKEINSDNRYKAFSEEPNKLKLDLDIEPYSLKRYLTQPFARFNGWRASNWHVWWDGSTKDGHRHFKRSINLNIDLKNPSLIRSAELYLKNIRVKTWTKSEISNKSITYSKGYFWRNKWTHHHNLIDRVKGEIWDALKKSSADQDYKLVIYTTDLESHALDMGTIFQPPK